MKKQVKFLCALLSAVLLLGTAPAAAAQPSGYWPYFTAYTDAVNAGDVDAALQTGDALLNFYSQFSMNQDIAEMSYNIYYYRYENRVYEKQGDYAAAIENLQKLYDCCVYLDSIGKDFSDMELICETLMRKLDPMTEVYALTSDLSDYPVYGASGEPAAGTYYGRVVSGEADNSSAVEGEAIASFYVQIETESADDFAYLIDPFDGTHVIHIGYNMTDGAETETAEKILSGACDRNITDTLNYLATLRSPVLLRIGAEMNLWQMDASLYQQAYLYIARKARALAPNVALVFSVNYVSCWLGEMADYYPGDSYVDWVGVSLYMTDFASSDSYASDAYFGRGEFADCILSIKEATETFGGKPILISECGANYVGSNGADWSADAAQQVRKLYSVLNIVYPQVKGIIYFDRRSPSASNNYTLSQNTAVAGAYSAAVRGNESLVGTYGSAADGVYLPLSDYTGSGSLQLAAYGMTVLGGSMTVSYTLDGVVVGGGSTVPYACTIDVSALSVGAHTLQVAFSDGAGYQETKSYRLAKLADGTITTDGSVEFPSDWAMDEVSAAISLGLVRQSFQRGYTENITRGDFCALVIDLIEAKTGQEIDDFLSEKGVSRESGAFTDSSSAEVLAASALGIVNGRGNGIFDPDAGITRQEAAKMLTAAANVLGMDTPNGSAISFADADSFAAWGAESIAFISTVNDKTSGLSVMGGVGDSRFDPNGGYTRQQAYITMLRLYRAL